MVISKQYLAGFFDGEGSMRLRSGFSRRSPLSIRVELKVTNTNLSILQAIQNEYGGKIRIKRNPSRPCYTLYWSNIGNIKPILLLLVPYLIVKKPHAMLLLEYLKHRGGPKKIRLSERDRAVFDELRAINAGARVAIKRAA